MFKSINEAHETLMDDRKRTDYDVKLKNFNNSKINEFDQAELRRKEEEIRRKQEELFRQEQNLREREQRRAYETKKPEAKNQINWGKVVKYLMFLNILLLLLVFLTPRNDEVSSSSPEPVSATKKKNQKPRAQSRSKKPTGKPQEADSLIIDADEPGDSLANAQTITPLPEIPAESNTLGNEAVPGETVEKTDTAQEKPKWYQFRKKRELKKKAAETEN